MLLSGLHLTVRCFAWQLVLFFNPVISGSAVHSDDGEKDTHQLMIFWQELFFREESSQLPFMRNAQEKERQDKKYGIPLDAFDRVRGFLFLDMAFAPDSNKTIISKAGDMRLEIFDKESSSCTTPKYQRLQDEYHQKVKAWHQEHDRMVLCPCNLLFSAILNLVCF
jgi:hypothetical protein